MGLLFIMLAASQFSDLSCIDDFRIPEPNGMWKLGSFATEAVVVLGDDARPVSIRLSGEEHYLQVAVERALRSSRFYHACRQKTLRIKFSFITHTDLALSTWRSWVVFKGPNHFVIHAYPGGPHIYK
jgi:hypothetical protein